MHTFPSNVGHDASELIALRASGVVVVVAARQHLWVAVLLSVPRSMVDRGEQPSMMMICRLQEKRILSSSQEILGNKYFMSVWASLLRYYSRRFVLWNACFQKQMLDDTIIVAP